MAWCLVNQRHFTFTLPYIYVYVYGSRNVYVDHVLYSFEQFGSIKLTKRNVFNYWQGLEAKFSIHTR